MAFPLVSVLTAAPGLIAAATDIIRLIREKKQEPSPVMDSPADWPGAERLQALESLVEKQARVIEDLALNNRNLTLAVRNNRIISLVAIALAVLALLVAM